MMPPALWPFYAGAAAIGAAVGAVEVFQRYRAEPLAALFNRWGATYLLFNGAVAGFAFYVAVVANSLGAGSPTLTLLEWMAGSGFGAAALLRSKLLTVQSTEGREVALGPEIVVQAFLTVIDKELDRQRGQARFVAVHRLMKDIDFDRAKVRLTAQLFQAMQRVTEEESGQLMERIAEIEQMKGVTGQDRSYLLGFYLLDLVGEEFLDDILSRCAGEFTALPEEPDTPPGAPGELKQG